MHIVHKTAWARGDSLYLKKYMINFIKYMYVTLTMYRQYSKNFQQVFRDNISCASINFAHIHNTLLCTFRPQYWQMWSCL